MAAKDWRATAASSRADTRQQKNPKVTKATGRKPKTTQRDVQKRVAARTQR